MTRPLLISAGMLVAVIGITAPGAVAVRTLPSAAPRPVTDLIVRTDTHLISLTWRLPSRKGVAGSEIVRFPGAAVVFRGNATSATDSTVEPGARYRYVVNTYDLANHRSRGVAVAALAEPKKLVQPQDLARLTVAPLLAWQAAPGASYYNVQLWAQLPGGPVKVFTFWPKVNRLQLPSTWTYEGKAQRLSKGTYRWYVWPGTGQLADARYGELIGSNQFFVVS
jgi:hypothetical protein